MLSLQSMKLVMRKRKILGQTGGHTFGRGYPTITGKYTDEMTSRDKHQLSKMLKSGENKPPQVGSAFEDNKTFKKDSKTGRIAFDDCDVNIPVEGKPKAPTGPK